MFVVGWLAAALGCSSSSPSAVAPVAADAGTDAATSCPFGTHESGAGSCDADLSWEKAGKLAPARNHHSSFAFKSEAGWKLYALGGVNDMRSDPPKLLGDLKVADVADDGSLGPWLDGRPLPQATYAVGMAMVGNVVVLVGGLTAKAVLTDTLTARINADGTLSEWRSGPDNPVARYHLTLSAHGDWVYAAGGSAVASNGSVEGVTTVTRAHVGADGVVGAWQPATPLAVPRSHHSAIVHDDALYLIGGGSGEPGVYYTDIIRATILDDGALGPWTKVADLKENVGTQPAVEHNGYLYLIGGIRGAKDDSRVCVANVRRAKFAADGSLGTWEDVQKLPAASGHVHQAPLIGNHLFYINGSDDQGGALADVLRGTFE